MDKPLVDNELAESEPQRRSGPWKLIIAVVVLTLIGVWLVPGESPQDDEGRATAPAPSLLGEVPDTATPEAEPSAPPGVIDERPGARARTQIAKLRAAGNISYADVFVAARQAQADGDLADAYLLYFFAARAGHGDSALALANQADPATRDPQNSVYEGADLTQAYKWYRVAAGSGDAVAGRQLAELRGRVEQLAADGDPEAQRISLLWQ